MYGRFIVSLTVNNCQTKQLVIHCRNTKWTYLYKSLHIFAKIICTSLNITSLFIRMYYVITNKLSSISMVTGRLLSVRAIYRIQVVNNTVNIDCYTLFFYTGWLSLNKFSLFCDLSLYKEFFYAYLLSCKILSQIRSLK